MAPKGRKKRAGEARAEAKKPSGKKTPPDTKKTKVETTSKAVKRESGTAAQPEAAAKDSNEGPSGDEDVLC